MLGLDKTGAVRASAAASSGRSRDIYRRYAVTLYKQALLTADDPASAEQVACDVIVNERALARMAERGEDDARPRAPRGPAALLHAMMRRLAASSAAVR